ncbi:hypothetical protein EYF80_056782 [Liparis tanakae]|uniref:Uncharacterized protein n=1 Tax=Liparis tanakae TaxID=230148 RepID=A0A4Z2EVS0_9TELE|nr:hypothetical protein EYF80_056782 [Liparis tanakae]
MKDDEEEQERRQPTHMGLHLLLVMCWMEEPDRSASPPGRCRSVSHLLSLREEEEEEEEEEEFRLGGCE